MYCGVGKWMKIRLWKQEKFITAEVAHITGSQTLMEDSQGLKEKNCGNPIKASQ